LNNIVIHPENLAGASKKFRPKKLIKGQRVKKTTENEVEYKQRLEQMHAKKSLEMRDVNLRA